MNATWDTPPSFTPFLYARGDWFTLTREWEVRLSGFLGDFILTVPENYITDGPSVPYGLQWLTPITSRTRAAATLHDALYTIMGGGWIPREIVDAVFRDELLEEGVSRLRARLMFRGVQIFGGRAWNDSSEADVLNTQRGTLPQLRPIRARVVRKP